MNSKILAITSVVICTIVIVTHILPTKTIKEEPKATITPLNLLLNNEMSSFEQTEVLDRDIEFFMRRWEFKGGSFALMRNDSLLYAKGYGYANDTVKCDVKHLLRIASASKLVTATAIMKLIEQGRVDLDSKVFGEEGILCDSMFLDLYNNNLKQITVEHLMRHTAGFSSPHGDPAFSNAGVAKFLEKDLPLTMDDMVLYATKNRLRSRPGDRYDYSNLGYIILSKIVEKVSNRDYEGYVQDSILRPIGCYDMHIGNNFKADRRANEVDYYEVKEATVVEACDGSGKLTMKSNGGNNVSLLSGAGGWIASPTELLRFVAAINNCDYKKNILSEKSITAMTYDSKRYKPMGWATVHGSEWIRSGSMAGTSALIKKQKDGYTWIFIANSSAWIGPRITSYISSHISRAISKVDEWPQRDLFEFEKIDSLTIDQRN